jgi:hypothetical protein
VAVSVTRNTATFDWKTNRASTGTVELKRNGVIVALANSTSSDGGVTHTATIGGLIPDTAYAFTVTAKSDSSCLFPDCATATGNLHTLAEVLLGDQLSIRVDGPPRVSVAPGGTLPRWLRVEMDVVIKNNGPRTLALGTNTRAATLQAPCPIQRQVSDCGGNTFITYSPVNITPITTNPLAPGQESAPVVITVDVAAFVFDGIAQNGASVLTLWEEYNVSGQDYRENPFCRLLLNGDGAELALDVTVDQPVLDPSGDRLLTYTFHVHNEGPHRANQVGFLIALAPGTSVVSRPREFTRCRSESSGTALRCDTDLDVPANGDFSGNVQIRVNNFVGLGTTLVASVYSDVVPDPDLGNNTSWAHTSFGSGSHADLEIRAVNPLQLLSSPRLFFFEFEVRNLGPDIAHNVTFHYNAEADHIASVYRVGSGPSGPAGPPPPTQGIVRPGIDLAPGASITMRVTLFVTAYGTGSVEASVSSFDIDPFISNNEVRSSVQIAPGH